jgi:hypothetical protein
MVIVPCRLIEMASAIVQYKYNPVTVRVDITLLDDIHCRIDDLLNNLLYSSRLVWSRYL